MSYLESEQQRRKGEPSWRRNNGPHYKAFSRRNKIYQAVKDISKAKCITAAQAVELLEAKRVEERMSISAFCEKFDKGWVESIINS